MRIRNGFVSNSSSSSFIIRGVILDEEDLLGLDWYMDINKKEVEDGDTSLFEEASSALDDYKQKIVVHENRDFFDGEDRGGFIFGVSLAQLEDGVITELPEGGEGDQAILRKLEEKLGKRINKPLRTYVQYISNDNY